MYCNFLLISTEVVPSGHYNLATISFNIIYIYIYSDYFSFFTTLCISTLYGEKKNLFVLLIRIRNINLLNYKVQEQSCCPSPPGGPRGPGPPWRPGFPTLSGGSLTTRESRTPFISLRSYLSNRSRISSGSMRSRTSWRSDRSRLTRFSTWSRRTSYASDTATRNIMRTRRARWARVAAEPRTITLHLDDALCRSRTQIHLARPRNTPKEGCLRFTRKGNPLFDPKWNKKYDFSQ
uniref:Uncharacterized protein n=1 Tax=Heterorhabditis bacteriophora TaxID=37862 RepID=A0A1I7WGT4_HETBA